MDLNRPVAYRNFQLNTPLNPGSGVPLDGCQLDRVEYYQVDAFGYREKRSMSDGLDASDVYLGARTVRLQGTLYAQSAGDLYDTMAQFRAAMLPTAAFAEAPGDFGYMPLTFEEATLDEINYPSGFIPKMMRVRALGTPRFVYMRDKVGGDSSFGYSVEWDIVFEAKDPRIYYQTATTVFFDATGTTNSGSGTVINRGAYPAPLKIEIFVPSANDDRVVELTAFGSKVKITVPGPTGTDRTARYDGVEKYLTLQSGGVEVLRMDLLEFPSGLQHPLVPPGSSGFSWTSTNIAGATRTINGLSKFFFWPAWA
jgi:hypothetical protein